MGPPGATEQQEGTALSPTVQEQQTRQWGMFLHLSVLAGFVVPIAGLVAPILIRTMARFGGTRSQFRS